jgi:pimeloyl-ACP methyl ester carboxylesterase
MHYVIGGKGDPVVLLHGWPETWFEWRNIIPELIANNYTVIAPDMRGLGDSEKPLTGYGTKTLADDIYQLVKKLGYNKIYIVAHDWGGPVAYSYAAAHLQDVENDFTRYSTTWLWNGTSRKFLTKRIMAYFISCRKGSSRETD